MAMESDTATMNEAGQTGGRRESKADELMTASAETIVDTWRKTVENSNMTGKGDSRRPQENFVYYANKNEIVAAVGVLSGVESVPTRFDKATGVEPSIVASLVNFASAAKSDVMRDVKGDDGKPKREKTGKTLEGIDALKDVAKSFKNSQFRAVHFDREKMIGVIANLGSRGEKYDKAVAGYTALGVHARRQANINKNRQQTQEAGAEM
ncbi:MAG: hypothetical protein EPN75_08800 [Beijerinckiaceae bacterium]|nr:MAG: hypothetical protein EPN75_08800 [Beijerinckiaceae bacterium]